MEENPELTPENIAPSSERTPMKVAMIVAMGENREIGRNNNLMWHLAEDMRFFKETTLGHYIVMGRKNFDSIPRKYKPLPERVNIIISRNPDFMYEECYTVSNLEEAMQLGRENGEELLFIIGGGQIYQMALDAGVVDIMYITHVKASFPDAEVFFPAFDESQWEKEHVQSGFSDSQNEFDFEIFKYSKK